MTETEVKEETKVSDQNGNKKKTFAVTGAGGFIGGQLVTHLISRGINVVAIVRDLSNSEDLVKAGAQTRQADVREPEQLRAAFADCDGVFHLAALFNDPERTWDDYRDINVQGSLNVLAAAQASNVGRVVHCSTVGVATEAHPPPYSEDTPYSPQPDDKYEVTKCEAEQAARQYASDNGYSLAVIRPAQVYGPGDRSKAKFYKLVKKGVIVNPGKTRKHLIHVRDLCHAFELAMTRPEADGEVFLIAGERPTDLTDLVSIAAKNLGVDEPKIKLPAWPVTTACAVVESLCNLVRIKPFIFKRSMDFFTRTVECDTRKSRDVLGFRSQVSVEDGVRETVDWYRSENII